MMHARIAAPVFAGACVLSIAHAQAEPSAPVARADRPASTIELPVAPALMPPALAFEIHTGFVRPLDHDALCPPDVGCLLRSGGGVGASLARMHASGFGPFAGYDVSFLDSDSVYELGVQQLFRAGVRYLAPTDIAFHPTFDIAVGGHVYGDTFSVATYGALIQAFGGAEIELTDSYALRIGFGLRAFTHTHFRSERDGARRGYGGIFTETVFGEVGLSFM